MMDLPEKLRLAFADVGGPRRLRRNEGVAAGGDAGGGRGRGRGRSGREDAAYGEAPAQLAKAACREGNEAAQSLLGLRAARLKDTEGDERHWRAGGCPGRSGLMACGGHPGGLLVADTPCLWPTRAYAAPDGGYTPGPPPSPPKKGKKGNKVAGRALKGARMPPQVRK
jgi:hypothetical protein